MTNLRRTVERWRACDPKAIAAGSEAQCMYALEDARADILTLADALSRFGTRPAAEPVKIDWQQRALDHGFTYWRAPDAHGVTATQEQALNLLRDLLGVEVDVEGETSGPAEPPPHPLTPEDHQVLRSAVRDSAEVVAPGRMEEPAKTGAWTDDQMIRFGWFALSAISLKDESLARRLEIFRDHERQRGNSTPPTQEAEPAQQDLDKLLTQVLNSRVKVEQELFDMAAGKKPMPDAAKLRELAVQLGDPTKRPAAEPSQSGSAGEAAISALRELLDAWMTEMPSAENGQEAQDAWADRRTKARNDARALLDAAPTNDRRTCEDCCGSGKVKHDDFNPTQSNCPHCDGEGLK